MENLIVGFILGVPTGLLIYARLTSSKPEHKEEPKRHFEKEVDRLLEPDDLQEWYNKEYNSN